MHPQRLEGGASAPPSALSGARYLTDGQPLCFNGGMTTTQEQEAKTTFAVGDGATECMWSDRHAGTIIEVSSNGKVVVWQADKATRTDGRGMSDAQTYEYERNPLGKTQRFSLRQDGTWVTVGASLTGGNRLVPGRFEYYDYSF